MQMTTRGAATAVGIGILGLAGVSAALRNNEPPTQKDLAANTLVLAARDTSGTVAALQLTVGQDTVRATSSGIDNNRPEIVADRIKAAQELHAKLGMDLVKWEAALAEYNKANTNGAR